MLSAPEVLESTLESAGLRVLERGETMEVIVLSDAEAACLGMMVGSAGVRAMHHNGEEPVRQVVLEKSEEFRTETGGYRFENRFRFLIAVADLA